MDNWLKNPWAIRFVSLILAILLYVAVSISQDPDPEDRRLASNGTSQTDRLSDVPVEILMDDDDDYVVSGVPETVVVDLEGANSVITPIIRQSTLDVYVDLRQYEPGTHQVNLKYSGVSEGVQVYIEPGTVEVTIEERATEEFAVDVDYMNESLLAEGYEIGEAVVEPETVTVVSSESEIERVASVKAYVNLEGAKASIEAREVPVNVYDSQGNELAVRVDPEVVSVSVEVLNPNKEVPVEIRTTGELQEELVLESITSQPADVTVFASEENLEGITEVSTEPVNLSQLEESGEMEVGLEIPEGAQSLGQEQVTVTVEIQQVVSSTFNDIEVRPENLAENRSLSFLDESSEVMEVKVFGKEEELSGLTKEDIQLSIDLAGAAAGEQIIPVNAKITGDLVTELEYEQLTVWIE